MTTKCSVQSDYLIKTGYMGLVNKKLVFYIAIGVLMLTMFCGNSIPYQDDETLNRPVGISVTAKSGLAFNITYTVQNEESVFDGYNIYMSRSTIGDAEINSIPPYPLDGTLPTVKHSAEDYNVNQTHTVTIEYYQDGVTRFEEGVTYFFRMVAHGRNNSQSLPSNEVSAVALP